MICRNGNEGLDWLCCAGTLPAVWGKGLVSLEALSISNTSVEGTLPSEWEALPALRTMYAEGSKLVGQLPPKWARLSNLTVLDLRHTAVRGPLPKGWEQLCRRHHEVGNMADRPPFARAAVYLSGQVGCHQCHSNSKDGNEPCWSAFWHSSLMQSRFQPCRAGYNSQCEKQAPWQYVLHDNICMAAGQCSCDTIHTLDYIPCLGQDVSWPLYLAKSWGPSEN